MTDEDANETDEVKSRDKLWNSVYDTHYHTSFHELTSDYLFAGWQRLDLCTKIIVTATASGSAIAGWQLWSQPDYKGAWAVMAGIAALLSILHTAFAVPARLKALSDCKRYFSSLRIDLETMRYQMEIFPKFDVHSINEQFLSLRKKYQEGVEMLPDDPLLTNKIRGKVQNDLNARIASLRKVQ